MSSDDDTLIQKRGEPEGSWPGFALPRGTVVNGYRIDRVLGSGGFGITYLALDLLQQRFAIKEYYPRQFATRQDMTVRPGTVEDSPLFEECKDRFLREAQALVLLGRVRGADDSIVRVQTYFEAFGTCFLVMDYVEGASLASVLHREPNGLPAERVRSILTQLLTSIRVVHQAGLVHRDVKPANIIMRGDDRLVLIDFGATRQAAPSETTSYTQIYSGGYGPPEQMLGLRQGPFSDIYAIGAVCYRAIGGSAVNALARKNSLAAGRPDPQPSAMTIGTGRYPKPLLTAIDAAMAVDPDQRPQNADAMLSILGRASGPAETLPNSPHEKPPGPRVRPAIWLTAAGAGAVIIGGAALFLLPRPATPPPSHPNPVVALTAPRPEPAPPQAPNVTPDPVPPALTAEPQPEALAPAPLDAAPSPPQVAIVPEPRPQSLPPAAAPSPEPAAAAPPPVTPVTPELPVVLPQPPPLPSPIERAEAAANSLSCAALRITDGPGGLRAAGFASPADLNGFFAAVNGAGRVIDEVTRVDRSACAALKAAAPAVRRTWTSAGPALAVRLEPSSIAAGGRVGIAVSTALPALYIDVFQADGSVRHLLRPATSGTTARRSVEWAVTPPAGARLVLAFAASSPLDLGTRPDTERDSEYLDVLRARLADTPTPVAADLALVTVRPETVVSRPPPGPPTSLRSARCANIVSRAQLGETLSDAELVALRTECRS